MRTFLLPVVALSISALPLYAQDPTPAVTAPAPVAVTLTRSVAVPEGTEFVGLTTEKLSSKTASEGDRIGLRVEEDVIVDGAIVIAKGAVVRGVVSEAKGAGRMGKGGKLNIRLESVAFVDGQRVDVRSTKGKAGDDKTGTTVALTVLFGPIGLLKKGSDAEIKEGTQIQLFTNDTKTVAVSTP